MTLRPILRFLTWLADSLPLYSRRSLDREWFRGREFERAQIGVVRDGRGRFVGVNAGDVARAGNGAAPKEKNNL